MMGCMCTTFLIEARHNGSCLIGHYCLGVLVKTKHDAVIAIIVNPCTPETCQEANGVQSDLGHTVH